VRACTCGWFCVCVCVRARAQANVKTGLNSPAVTVSTTRVIYMKFLQNLSFQSGQICCYFYMLSIQIILFFLCYEVPLILTSTSSPFYVTFLHYYVQ
jgi:hypothetical protein